jgi:hypothetical protein
MIVSTAPLPIRSFKAFRTLKPAISFLTKRGNHSNLVVRHYGNDERDVRYIVNFVYGDLAESHPLNAELAK